MTSIKAALATFHGAGFIYGIGETCLSGDELCVRFATASDTSRLDVPIRKGNRGDEVSWNGSRLTSAIPVMMGVGLPSGQLTIDSFVGGRARGIGVLAIRSKGLRFDALEPLPGLPNQSDANPRLLYTGGEGVGISTLQVGNRASEDQHQVFVLFEGQSIIVIDEQGRAGHIRFAEEMFSLRQLTLEDVYRHVIGRAAVAQFAREARWCLRILQAAGFGGETDFVRVKLEVLARKEEQKRNSHY